MKEKIDTLIINNCPAFYKINLYNELAKHKKIFVIFLGLSNQVVTGSEFKEKIKFPYILINDFQVEKRSKFKTFLEIWKITKFYKPNKIIYGGYIEPELIFLSYIIPKSKNILQSETAGETKLQGIRFYIKKIILRRYSQAIVSGKSHESVILKMGFRGNISISKGVGFIEKTNFLRNQADESLKFLYIGRLISVKNLELLIDAFNENGLPLTIVGKGNQESLLKAKSNTNINFIGFVENSDIWRCYTSHDIFILPSLSESWGLVAEEALYYGCPLLLSNNVGSVNELITENNTGVTFDPLSKASIQQAIEEIVCNYKLYKNNVTKFSIEEKDKVQLESYLNI